MSGEREHRGPRRETYRVVPRGRRFGRRGFIKTVVLWTVVIGAIWFWTKPKPDKAYPIKCVVVGLDGLDPNLVRQWMDAGELPNLKRLAKEGSFVPLATSCPPQSPVAWCSFATGMNPGGTGVFDFVDRDPQTYVPGEAMSKVKSAADGPPLTLPVLGIKVGPILAVGPYRIPLRSDEIELSRKGTPFWKYLEKAGVPSTVLRVPSNFPPTSGATRQLTGMGTPDLTGSTGSYFYWTDRKLTEEEHKNARSRATIEEVVVQDDGRVIVPAGSDGEDGPRPPRLTGPPNLLKPDPEDLKEKRPPSAWKPMFADLAVTVDRKNGAVRIQLGDSDALLKRGEWTDWMPVKFTMIRFVSSVAGMVRFHVKNIEPFELYASPINIDPLTPAMPISNPADYSKELAETLGRFTTLGMPENDTAIESKVRALDEAAFRRQCRDVLEDNWRTTQYELNRYHGGFLFTYFRTTDVMSHMLWYVMDSRHPAFDAVAARLHHAAIEEGYRWVDEKVGQIRKLAGDDALFIVMSDHGFSANYRQFNLNGWLADNGWMTLLPDADLQRARLPGDVDWAATKAYALGLNSLYINTIGREREGAVAPDDRELVAEQLCRALEQIVDPETGEHVVTRAFRREEVYTGPYVDRAPDIIVGYNCHYRTTGSSALGVIAAGTAVEKDGKTVMNFAKDNLSRWSGDHCCDPAQVPGVLFSSRPVVRTNPGLTDLAPTILQEFHIAKPADMTGSPVVSPNKG